MYGDFDGKIMKGGPPAYRGAFLICLFCSRFIRIHLNLNSIKSSDIYFDDYASRTNECITY